MSTSAWRAKAERAIAALALAAYNAANTNKDGTRKKRHVPYRLPEVADRLVGCLGRNDEETAKAILLFDYEVEQVMKGSP